MPNPAGDDHFMKRASGEVWSVPVPPSQGQAQYAAFRIAGKTFRILDDSGKEIGDKRETAAKPSADDSESGALRIAMTPLTKGAP